MILTQVMVGRLNITYWHILSQLINLFRIAYRTVDTESVGMVHQSLKLWQLLGLKDLEHIPLKVAKSLSLVEK